MNPCEWVGMDPSEWVECPDCQGEGGWPTSEPKRKRLTFLRVDQMRMLDHWCETLRRTFGEVPYLVGSVLTTATYRDVDIRIPLDDDAVARIPMRLRDLNMLLSRWGQDVTGLPIDCQVQSLSEFRGHNGPVIPRGLVDAHKPTEV